MVRSLSIVGLISASAVLLAACGVRGGLEYPQQTRAESATAATADAGQGKPQGATGKAHRSSVLDRLIQ